MSEEMEGLVKDNHRLRYQLIKLNEEVDALQAHVVDIEDRNYDSLVELIGCLFERYRSGKSYDDVLEKIFDSALGRIC